MNAIVPADRPTSAISSLAPSNLSEAMRLADMMCRGSLVPKALQGSPSDCLMVIEQASRWNMSPFAVAQSTSVIQGKLMFEGKLVAAAIQSCGILDGRLDYEFAGDGEERTCTCTGRIRGETKPKTAAVKLKDVKTTNQMWAKQPDQQLIYSVSRVWGRRWAPEVMLGVYAPEEFSPEAPRDQMPPAAGPTITSTAERLPSAPPAPEQKYTLIMADTSVIDCPSLQHWQRWFMRELGKLESATAVASWREAMRPHIEAVAADDPSFETGALGEIEDRLDALANAEQGA
ncbi:recombinase RecT [Roseococcus pinisoli]|uniref:Recombinase RecT n=1 Tax=Roseococcus pinisoli TaxID=2835040 RepID=A0ABS5QE30_9PROT|nr:recombinase RecT [Roseococcus pinisoli]MBS7811177.1 recombinase RecT [Roseococcus pinisoli]